MIDKRSASAREAVADVHDGATVMIGGFGEAGSPIELIHALIDQGASGLTVVSNNTGTGLVGLAALLRAGRVRKVVCSFPRTAGSTVFPDLYRAGKVELELVPQGTLAERIRAGGAGIAAFYTPRARRSPTARRCAPSTAASTSSSTGCAPTSRSSRDARPTSTATCSTTARRETSRR
jgi:3-oxoadipate CoA-transferase alpha subunit